jgi:hypothetical protein
MKVKWAVKKADEVREEVANSTWKRPAGLYEAAQMVSASQAQ